MPRPLLSAAALTALWVASALGMAVFREPPSAHMLLRSRRANSFLEELKPGDKERECIEENCDFEEAREIFITREATLEFWIAYTDADQCTSQPCVHGRCVDMIQAYHCHCHQGYEGKHCDYPQTATNCSLDNGGCNHDCLEEEGGLRRTCSCIEGWRLEDDGRTCSPKGDKSCGQLLSKTSYPRVENKMLPWAVGGEVGKKGESPWQVLLLNAVGRFHCGGVLIDPSWVLTAAHCLQNNVKFWVRLGDYERQRDEGTEALLKVTAIFSHPSYDSGSLDNDIGLLRLERPVALTDFILPVCMPGRALAEGVLNRNGTMTVVTGWGKNSLNATGYSSALNVIRVPLVDSKVCARHMTNNITDNVLCAGILGRRVDACEGDSGGPMVTLYDGTWFLVGLVSWGEGCGREDKLGVFTKVSNYHEWIDEKRRAHDASSQA